LIPFIYSHRNLCTTALRLVFLSQLCYIRADHSHNATANSEGPMKQRWLATLVIGLFWGGVAVAQEANWQYRWRAGQVLTYRAEHKTNVEENAEGTKVTTASNLAVVKRWQVVDVDAKGFATLKLSLAAMRNEQTRPSGEIVLFDSAQPDKGTPELRDQMSKFIGQTLAVLRIDSQGQVREVKQGSATRYEAEPPFALVLPAVAPQEGLAWLRSYNMMLEPPFGAGEKLPSSQRYECTSIAGGKAIFKTAHQLKTMPENAKEQVPIIQRLPEGQITFDLAAGHVLEVHFRIDRTLMNHHGDGSSYHFQSTFTEKLVDVK
jgi:hypothetical protein